MVSRSGSRPVAGWVMAGSGSDAGGGLMPVEGVVSGRLVTAHRQVSPAVSSSPPALLLPSLRPVHRRTVRSAPEGRAGTPTPGGQPVVVPQMRAAEFHRGGDRAPGAQPGQVVLDVAGGTPGVALRGEPLGRLSGESR